VNLEFPVSHYLRADSTCCCVDWKLCCMLHLWTI